MFDLLRPLGASFGMGAAYGGLATHDWTAAASTVAAGVLMAALAWRPLPRLIFPKSLAAVESTSEAKLAFLYVALLLSMATAVFIAASAGEWLVSG
jgi:hypothetical protein